MNTYTYVSRPDHGQPAEISQQQRIRTWRVGSLSMGITLILIGTALAVSLWQKMQALDLLLLIAPVVIIMLGCELLVYLKLSGKETMYIRFDWLSVMFVGTIGAASVVLSLLMSTGLIDDLKREFQMTQRSVYIDPVTFPVADNIKEVIVQSSYGVNFDKADTEEIHLFGSIQYLSAERLNVSASELFKTTTIGNTMYVNIGELDKKAGGFVRDYVYPSLTIVVPERVNITYN